MTDTPVLPRQYPDSSGRFRNVGCCGISQRTQQGRADSAAGPSFLSSIVVAVTLGPFVVRPLDRPSSTSGPRKLRGRDAGRTSPFGTDQLGRRTILARMMAGGPGGHRQSVWTANLIMRACSVPAQSAWLPVFFRKLERCIDGAERSPVLALPLLPLLLAMVMLFSRNSGRAVFGPEMGTFILIVSAIGITSWMQKLPTHRSQRGSGSQGNANSYGGASNREPRARRNDNTKYLCQL